jgi:hypothetical protein
MGHIFCHLVRIVEVEGIRGPEVVIIRWEFCKDPLNSLVMFGFSGYLRYVNIKCILDLPAFRKVALGPGIVGEETL